MYNLNFVTNCLISFCNLLFIECTKQTQARTNTHTHTHIIIIIIIIIIPLSYYKLKPNVVLFLATESSVGKALTLLHDVLATWLDFDKAMLQLEEKIAPVERTATLTPNCTNKEDVERTLGKIKVRHERIRLD